VAAAQLAEELLEVGKRDLLALADAGERYRPGIAVQRQVEHRGHCEPALGRQSHRIPLENPSKRLKYRQFRAF
jgi:hypothetical protein